MIKSLLRYPGGKSKALKHILPLIPNFKEYREPFVGGASLYLALKQIDSSAKKFWINDIYFELYTFWKEIKNNLNLIIEQVNMWKAIFMEGRGLYCWLLDNMENFDSIKKASAFFILNRITFSGTTEAGGFSKASFEKRFTTSSVERLELMRDLFVDTIITNYDYEDVLLKEGEDVFIFLDPPYCSNKKSALYGKGGEYHKYFDHFRFSECVKKINHKYLITYDDSEYIRELFSFATIHEWDNVYGMRKDNNVVKEIFITNYF